MPYEREKEQVVETLTNNNVAPNVQNRFIVWSRHPSCDKFIQQACDYIDAHFAMQRLQLQLERRVEREKMQEAKRQLHKRFTPRRPMPCQMSSPRRGSSNGASPRRTSLKPLEPQQGADHGAIISPVRPPAKPPTGPARPTSIVTTQLASPPDNKSPSKVQLQEQEKELGGQLQRALGALAKSYLFVLFNFGDFCKIHEDETFFWGVNRLVANVVRLVYGISAQKRAEVELRRLFSSQMFNSAQRKHSDDPEVSGFILAADKKSVPKSTIKMIRQASRVRSNLLSCFIPTAQDKFRLKYGNPKKRGNSHNPCGDPTDKWRTLRSPRNPLELQPRDAPPPIALNAPTPMMSLQMGAQGGHNAFIA